MRGAAVVWLGALHGACVRQLPPPAIPTPVAPPIAASAPPESGKGRLVIEVVDGPAPIQRIRMEPEEIRDPQGRSRFLFAETPELLCAVSPCVVDVPIGNVLLGFPVIGNPGDLEVELVHVGPQPSAYRRTSSVYQNHTGALRVLGIVGASAGSAAAITGVALLPIGLAKDNSGLATAGAISLGLGAAVLTLGIWAIWRDAPTFRPASSNHFPL